MSDRSDTPTPQAATTTSQGDQSSSPQALKPSGPPAHRPSSRQVAKQAGLLLNEPLIFERSRPGRSGFSVPGGDADPTSFLPAALLRGAIDGFPEVSEPEVLRHFLRLSQWNLGTATTFYPLGSCTMKYNPVANEAVARSHGFAALHPLTPDDAAQGALEVIWEHEPGPSGRTRLAISRGPLTRWSSESKPS